MGPEPQTGVPTSESPLPVEHMVVRPRLHRALDAGAERGCAFVSAPLGSGKTQLAVAWARDQRVHRETAWLPLEESQGDPAAFARAVVAALETTSAGAAAVGVLRRRSAAASFDTDPLGVLSDVARALRSDVVLVLDGFHLVVGSGAEDLLRRLLRHPLGRLRLLVLSRIEPNLEQTRLRLQGQLVELSAPDLAFARGEVAELLRLQGLQPSDDDVQSLHTATDGWAMALSAAAAGAAVPGIGDGALHEYLLERAYDVEPPEIQRFLLRTSVVNPVCGDLADVLTDGSGGGRTLSELHRANVFLERLQARPDAECAWYRWNPTFAAALESRLHATDPGLQSQLHRIAGRWLGRRGCAAEAVRHSVAGKDLETATGLLTENWLDLIIDTEPSVVSSVLQLIPEADRAAHAELALVDAFLAMTDRDPDRATRSIERADALAAALPVQQRLAVRVMSAALRLEAATLSGRDVGAESYRSAVALLAPRSTGPLVTSVQRRRRALLLYHLGAYELSRWMPTQSADHLQEAVAEGAAADVPCLVLRSRVLLAVLELDAGRLGRAHSMALEALEAAESQGWHRHDNVGTAQVVLASVHLLRGEVDAALEHLRLAAGSTSPVDRVGRFRVGFVLQHALRRQGDLPAARSEVDRVARMVQDWDAPGWVRALATAAQAEQLAAEGHPRAALHRIAAAVDAVSATEPDRNWRIACAHLLLLNGRPADARVTLDPVLRAGTPGSAVVLALLVDALAAHRLDRPDEALLSLARALRSAAPELLVEPFAMCGLALRPLLEQLLDLGTPEAPFAREVLDRLPPAGSPVGPASPEPLTRREREVLDALQGPLTNEEIARTMFVSVNTLRSHIKQINRKLGTTSRSAAVARARDLGLVEPGEGEGRVGRRPDPAFGGGGGARGGS